MHYAGFVNGHCDWFSVLSPSFSHWKWAGLKWKMVMSHAFAPIRILHYLDQNVMIFVGQLGHFQSILEPYTFSTPTMKQSLTLTFLLN